MAVTKVNGFVAPYRSATFQGQTDKIVQSSGLIKMDGSVYESGPNLVVPPFEFVQNGLIVSVDEDKLIDSVSKPAPYYLTVTANSTNPIDDLSFQFPESPEDISGNQVIISYYDGNEWRKPQLLSISAIYDDIDEANILFGRVGPVSGLTTEYASSVYTNSPGTIVDRQGLRQTLEEPYAVSETLEDDFFDRVDRIVYRRPNDNVNRIGMRKYIVGGAHATAVTASNVMEALDDSYVHTGIRTLIGSDNAAHFLVARGYGETFSLVYFKVNSSRTSILVAATEVVTGLDSHYFDACIDESNNIHIACISDSVLNYAKISSTGSTLIAKTVFPDQPIGVVSKPSCFYSESLSTVFIATQVLEVNNRIYFQSVFNQPIFAVIISPKLLAFTGVVSNPSIFVTDDNIVYVAVENSLSQILLGKFNDIGILYETVSTIASDAKDPKILVTDNKSVFVTYLKDMGSSYSLRIWNDGSTYSPSYTTGTGTIEKYSVDYDDFLNGLHFWLDDGAGIHYVKVESGVVKFGEVIQVTPSSDLFTVRDNLGAMLHSFSYPLSSSFVPWISDKHIDYIGAQTVIGIASTVYMVANQLMVPTSGGFAPKIGDQIVITGATNPSNNITSVITGKALCSLNSANDYFLLGLEDDFVGYQIDVGLLNIMADFNNPAGNAVTFIKTNSELTEYAFTREVLSTDVLLSRIVLPGPTILNYSDSLVGPSPAETDKLIAFGNNVELSWTGATLTIGGGIGIKDLVNDFTYTIQDGEYGLSEGDALYLELDISNDTPVPQIAPINELSWADPIKVLGIVKEGNFVPHFLLSSLAVEEMEPGETVFTGHDLPDILRGRLGIIDDTQYQEYDNHNNFLLEDNYPTAISKLDAYLQAVRDDKNDEEVYIVPAGGLTNYTAYTPGFVWDASNEALDIIVFVNGKKQTQDKTGTTLKDFKKIDTNELQFTYTVPEDAEITIFRVRTGGGAPGYLHVEKDNVQIGLNCQVLNFIGQSITAYGGDGKVNIVIGSGANSSTTKLYRNTSGSVLAAKTAVAFDDVGGVVPADANLATLSDFAGVTLDSIPVGGDGIVVKLGDVPEALIGMGAIPGDVVYLGQVPGTLSLVPPSGLSDTIFVIGRAEPVSGEAPDGTATSLFISPQVMSAGV